MTAHQHLENLLNLRVLKEHHCLDKECPVVLARKWLKENPTSPALRVAAAPVASAPSSAASTAPETARSSHTQPANQKKDGTGAVADRKPRNAGRSASSAATRAGALPGIQAHK